MKTILVLTDFSENAAHAAKSAMALSENLHADILLYNSFVMAPATPYYAGGPIITEGTMWFSDEVKEQLQKLAERLEAGCDKLAEGQFKPKITCATGEGDLGKDVADIIESKNIELVVMGARSGGSIEHILMGSDTNSVIKHTTRPVLVVPPKSAVKSIKKMVFATDFNEGDMKAIHYLNDLRKVFHFDIEVVHVSIINENNMDEIEEEFAFASYINSLKDAGISYKNIKGKDVIKRLNHYVDEANADVLAVVHRKDSFLSWILRTSTTKDALSNQKMPLLIIPSKMTQ